MYVACLDKNVEIFRAGTVENRRALRTGCNGNLLRNSSSWNLHRNVRALITLTVRSKMAASYCSRPLWEKCTVILLKEECGGEWVLDRRC